MGLFFFLNCPSTDNWSEPPPTQLSVGEKKKKKDTSKLQGIYLGIFPMWVISSCFFFACSWIMPQRQPQGCSVPSGSPVDGDRLNEDHRGFPCLRGAQWKATGRTCKRYKWIRLNRAGVGNDQFSLEIGHFGSCSTRYSRT